MIPRNLARLAYDAVDHGWNITIRRPAQENPFTDAEFRRGDTALALGWDLSGLLVWSTVNGVDAPYVLCTRLIRSPEGATS